MTSTIVGMPRSAAKRKVPAQGGIISDRSTSTGDASSIAGGSRRDEFQYCLLCLVAVRPMTSYDISHSLQNVIRYMWSAADSQVSSGLARLEKDGLIEAEETWVGKRRKRVFFLTGTGRRLVDEWLEAASPERPPKDSFMMKLFFMGESTGTAAAQHLVGHLAHTQSVLNHCTTMRDRFGGADVGERQRMLRFQLLTLDLTIARAEAEIALTKEALRILERGIDDFTVGTTDWFAYMSPP